MENFMDYCISLNSIKGFVVSHWVEVLITYLAITWALGLALTRKEFSQFSKINGDMATCCAAMFILSPIWIPVLFIWNILDLSGRRLREKNKE